MTRTKLSKKLDKSCVVVINLIVKHLCTASGFDSLGRRAARLNRFIPILAGSIAGSTRSSHGRRRRVASAFALWATQPKTWSQTSSPTVNRLLMPSVTYNLPHIGQTFPHDVNRKHQSGCFTHLLLQVYINNGCT